MRDYYILYIDNSMSATVILCETYAFIVLFLYKMEIMEILVDKFESCELLYSHKTVIHFKVNNSSYIKTTFC